MPLPKIDTIYQKMPLCYDPTRNKFIYYPEIISGKEKIIPVETLSESDFKKLVIERLRSAPPAKGGPLSNPFMSNEDTIQAIERDEKYGQQVLEGEKSMLMDLLKKF